MLPFQNVRRDPNKHEPVFVSMDQFYIFLDQFEFQVWQVFDLPFHFELA